MLKKNSNQTSYSLDGINFCGNVKSKPMDHILSVYIPKSQIFFNKPKVPAYTSPIKHPVKRIQNIYANPNYLTKAEDALKKTIIASTISLNRKDKKQLQNVFNGIDSQKLSNIKGNASLPN